MEGGRPLLHAYLGANPRGPMAGYYGHMHAKVMLTRARMIVGSTNYTTGSQANEEISVEVEFSEQGAALAHRLFQTLWDQGRAFDGNRAGPSRGARNRGRSAHP